MQERMCFASPLIICYHRKTTYKNRKQKQKLRNIQK